MEEINWIRGADGNATHYDPVDENYLLQVVNHSFVWHSGKGWANHGGQYPADLSKCERLVKRQPSQAQQSWTGEGLPPVGIECEYRVGVGPWYRCVVGYLFEDEDGPCAVLKCPHLKYEQVACIGTEFGSVTFRPLRTPEQIAAEEREKAIEKMLAILPAEVRNDRRGTCSILYDAGLRFPQGGAQ